MHASEWYLSADERGNPATRLDARHTGSVAWTEGNLVRPLIHGATYFAELAGRIADMQAGDLLMFADWRGDPDEQLTGTADSEIGRMLAAAARRGVDVRGLVWRSHLDRLAFSSAENRHLGEEVNAAGGQCVLDMRVRVGGSHHQKLVVLRHPGRPERDIAFLGGIDLCHSRRDDASHEGDPQAQSMAAVFGPRPPWHDVAAGHHRARGRGRGDHVPRAVGGPAATEPLPAAVGGRPPAPRPADHHRSASPAAGPSAGGPAPRAAAAHLPASAGRLPLRSAR